MATTPEITGRLEAATEKAENASQIIYDVANGDASAEVPTASGPTPTLKKWFQDLGSSLEPMLAGIPARLDKAVLVYQTKIEAEAAAATLPDGQAVEDQAGQSEYKVSSGVLVIVKRDAFNVFTQGAGRGDPVKDLEVFSRAASLGGKILVPAGEYTINAPTQWMKSTQLVLEKNATIYANTGSADSAFVFQGAGRGSKVTLTTDALKNTDRITLPSVAGFSVGGWVLIGDDAARASSGPKSGEYQKIVAIEGNTVIFAEWLNAFYRTSRAAFIQPAVFLDGVAIEGCGRIVGNSTGTPSTNGPIRLDLVNRFDIAGFDVEGFFKNGILTGSTMFGNFSDLNFRGITDPTQGYGIVVTDGSQWINTFACYSHGAAKLWDVGGLSSANGYSRFLNVRDCAAYQATRGGISTHPQCDFVNIDNIDVYAKISPNDVTPPYQGSFYIRGANISLRNSRSHGSIGNGVNWQTSGVEGYVELLNNDIRDSANHGVIINTAPGTQDAAFQFPPTSIRIEGNDIGKAGAYGLYTIIGSTGNVPIVRIEDNDVRSTGYASFLDVQSGGGITELIEGGNTYISDGGVVTRTAVASGSTISSGGRSDNTIRSAAANAIGIQEAITGTSGVTYANNRINAEQATSGVPASRFGKNRRNGKVICGDAWALQANSFTRVASTGTTDEVTLATIPLQKRLIGNNGGIKVTALFTLGEATNTTKTVRAKLTGVTSGAVATSSTFYENSSVNKTVKAVRVQLEIWNNNNFASQRGGPIDLGFGNGGNQNLVFGSVDTRESFNVVLTGQIGDPADTVRLESYTVETIYQAT